MTVPNSNSVQQYQGNATSVAFSFPYVFFEPSDLLVTLYNTTAAANVTPAPVLNGGATYDYTVTGIQDPDSGEYLSGAIVTFNNAPLANYNIVLQRNVPATQLIDLIDNSKFPASTVNGALDRLTMICQQLMANLGQAVLAPLGTLLTPLQYLTSLIAQIASSVVTATDVAQFPSIATLLVAYPNTVTLPNGFLAQTPLGPFQYLVGQSGGDNGGTQRVDGAGRVWVFTGARPTLELFGAAGTGAVNDLPAAVAAAAVCKVFYATPGNSYRFDGTLTLSTLGQQFTGAGAANDLSSGFVTQIILNHANDGIVLNAQGVQFKGFKVTRPSVVQGAGTAAIRILNASYCRLEDLRVDFNAGYGIIYDGSGSACFFNERNNVSVLGSGTACVNYTGANCTVNRAFGGKLENSTGDGIQYNSGCADNKDTSVDIEQCTAGNGVTNNSNNINILDACHIEGCNYGLMHNQGGLSDVNCLIVGSITAEEAGTNMFAANRMGTLYGISGTIAYAARVVGMKLGTLLLGSTATEMAIDAELFANTNGASIDFFKTTGNAPVASPAPLRAIRSWCWGSAGVLSNLFSVQNTATDTTLVISFGPVQIWTGIGNPNSAISAPEGSLYLNQAGGSGTALYVKESGSAFSTGWVGK